MNNKTRNLTLAAVFAALSIAFKLLSMNFNDFRLLNFSPITLLLAGYFLGLKQGLLIAFLTDTVYAFFLSGNIALLKQADSFWGIILIVATKFWNLFTVSTMLWGASGAFIRMLGLKRPLVALIIVAPLTGITETALNTIQMLWGHPSPEVVISGLPLRIFNQLFRVPLIIMVTNTLMVQLEQKDLKLYLNL